MPSPAPQIKIIKKKTKTPLIVTLACLGALILFVAVDAFTPVGGNIRFYVTWAECGERPYRRTAIPFQSVSYYTSTPIFSLFRQHHVYYCNPLEAEKAGVSANPNYYDFPNLEKQGLPWPL